LAKLYSAKRCLGIGIVTISKDVKYFYINDIAKRNISWAFSEGIGRIIEATNFIS